MAQEEITKLLNPELEEPTAHKFEIFGKLVELEAQNAISTT
jgi:hypothetical protein